MIEAGTFVTPMLIYNLQVQVDTLTCYVLDVILTGKCRRDNHLYEVRSHLCWS